MTPFTVATLRTGSSRCEKEQHTEHESQSAQFPHHEEQQSTAGVELRITGNISTPLTLSIADLKTMPRKTLKVLNPHEKKAEVYEGVPLQELLRRAGVPQGDGLRGTAMATYVLAEAADGYRVVFSLAELDSDFVDAEVIVADTLDGAPLGPKQGPFKIVAPHEKPLDKTNAGVMLS